MKKLDTAYGACVLTLFVTASLATAQDGGRYQDIRLSYKIVEDANGNFPDGASEAAILGHVADMNAAMEEYGRGYRFVLDDPVTSIGGTASTWFDTDFFDPDHGTDWFSEFRAQAFADPDFLWNDRAVNLYVVNGTAGGVCQTPLSLAFMVVGGATGWVTHLHELGHWFGLDHTHGPYNCDSIPDHPGSDYVADTLPDLPMWGFDDIARETFDQIYSLLDADERRLVEDTFHNILSYRGTTCGRRGTRSVLTDGQLDRWEDTVHVFETRAQVRNGRIYFVNVQGQSWNPNDQGSPPLGSSTRPLFFGSALNGPIAADGADQLVMRPGTYLWNPGILDQPVTLRATRAGSVTVRR